MRAVIVGAGVAGPAVAIALRRVGLEVSLHEAGSPSRAGAGAFLQLAPNGVNALRALGLEEVLAAAGAFPTSGITFSNARGRIVGALESRDEVTRYGAANALVKRGRLHVALREAAAARGIPVHFGQRLVDHVRAPHGVEARFADGTTAAGDLLIACDGLGSRVRAGLLPGAPGPRSMGLVNLGGFAHLPLREPGRTHMVFGHRAFFGYTASPEGEVFWFSNLPRPRAADLDGDGRSPAQWLEVARHEHARDPDPVPRILASAPPPVGAWPVRELPALPTWHDDRVCLVGDAAHAMSPSAGQGASVALEDAVVLAACLHDAPAPVAAFASYQRLRKPRAERIARQAHRNSSAKVPGPLGGVVRDLLLPLFLRAGVTQAARTYAHRVALTADAGLAG